MFSSWVMATLLYGLCILNGHMSIRWSSIRYADFGSSDDTAPSCFSPSLPHQEGGGRRTYFQRPAKTGPLPVAGPEVSPPLIGLRRLPASWSTNQRRRVAVAGPSRVSAVAAAEAAAAAAAPLRLQGGSGTVAAVPVSICVCASVSGGQVTRPIPGRQTVPR